MDLAVGLELLNEPGKALTLYHELATRLSGSLSGIAQRKEGEESREEGGEEGRKEMR